MTGLDEEDDLVYWERKKRDDEGAEYYSTKCFTCDKQAEIDGYCLRCDKLKGDVDIEMMIEKREKNGTN